VINFTDDVRIFAGCITGRSDWPLKTANKIDGHYLEGTLAHCEVKLTHVDDDPVRPKLFCQSVHQVNHTAFKGYNRAQLSVLEAAILLSRVTAYLPKKSSLSWNIYISVLIRLRALKNEKHGTGLPRQ